jgi:hypothetical protein
MLMRRDCIVLPPQNGTRDEQGDDFDAGIAVYAAQTLQL